VDARRVGDRAHDLRLEQRRVDWRIGIGVGDVPENALAAPELIEIVVNEGGLSRQW
jgi:hypothetical protein